MLGVLLIRSMMLMLLHGMISALILNVLLACLKRFSKYRDSWGSVERLLRIFCFIKNSRGIKSHKTNLQGVLYVEQVIRRIYALQCKL